MCAEIVLLRILENSRSTVFRVTTTLLKKSGNKH